MIIPRERPRIIETRNYKTFDMNAFAEDLKKIPWELLNRFHDPSEMWRMWKAFFNRVLNAHAPIRTKRVRNRDALWITSDIRSMMFRRDYLKKHAAKNRSEANWTEYCKLRNKVNNKLKTCKINYFVQNLEASKGYAKKTWKLLNNLLNKKGLM